MPYAAKKPCSQPGCPNLVKKGYCSNHKHLTPKSRYDKSRASAAKRGYGHTWRKLRKMVLSRQPICQMHGCNEWSTDVDHIVPKAQGGDNRFKNLQGLCHRHHSIKTMREQQITITIVAGAPCSGKTTYVAKHKGENDVVLDMDYLYQGLTYNSLYNKPMKLFGIVNGVYDYVIDRLARRCDDVEAWIITGECNKAKLQATVKKLNARLVIMATTKTECKERLSRSGERQHLNTLLHKAIDDWYAELGDGRLQATEDGGFGN